MRLGLSRRLVRLRTAFGCALAAIALVAAPAIIADASQPNLTGSWQHIGPQGQTTLRIQDDNTDVHVVVEGFNFLTFDEMRFVSGAVDSEVGDRLLTCERNGDVLVTTFRKTVNTTKDGETKTVVVSSKKFVWSRMDPSTMTITVSGTRGRAQMLPTDYVFSRKD